MFDFKNAYNRADFLSFLQHDFLPEDFDPKEEPIDIDFPSTYATEVYRIGVCKSLELEVFEVYHDSSHDARVGISKDAFQLLLKKSLCNRALVVFVPTESEQYRLSLIQIDISQSRIRRTYSNPRRYSFLLGKGAHTKTPEQFLIKKGRIKPKDGSIFKDLQERFSVEVLTKLFYKELSDWYFWAIKNVSFPNDIHDDNDDEKYNLENVIRLITRLIFVWFLKQKDLVSNDLFNKESLMALLKDFKPESTTQNNYYRAILQNLFFATLNQEIGKRGFAEDKGFLLNRGTNTVKNLYRYENEFKLNTAEIMNKFSRVPFLNGGLFECLDNKEKDGKKYCWDGFSRDAKLQANVPNKLFFAKEQVVDLSKEYNDKKMNAVKVSGIIEILDKYNFTVEENTPIEVEVALDPELLGKVFENLLGAFNPETQETARKQTGSFYTPREIVNYMVNESLIAYFKTKVSDVAEQTLRSLFSYEENSVELSETDCEKLIQAIFNCKILDPATGSGAFPMGILQQMVHLLQKLDPDNEYWSQIVLQDALKAFENAEQQNDEDIDQVKDEIDSIFNNSVNNPNYARKLYLIENCIYGVDIQSIAVQISKLRFFISLVCEQTHSDDASENFGIRPLPNLETKFVAANTLIGIEKAEEDMELFNDDHIKKLIDKLQHLRHRQFTVTNAADKKKLRDKDKDLRFEIENEVTQLYVKHKDENRAFFMRQKMLMEKELELLDRSVVKSTSAATLFGDTDTKTYKPNEKRRKELNEAIKTVDKKLEDASKLSRLDVVVRLAQQLTSWNPYDQNDRSSFFDAEWMFGLKVGFDIVIGNPPYIKEYTDKSAFDGIRNSDYYQGKMDLWYLFACKGIDFLNNAGHLCFIATNNWVTNAGASKMRNKVISDSKIIQLVDFGNFMIFESASIQTMVMIFEKNKVVDNYSFDFRKLSGNTTKTDSIDLLFKNENSKATYLIPTINRNQNLDSLLTFNNTSDDNILDKIHHNSVFFTEKEVANGIHPHYDFVNNKIATKHGITVGQGIFGLSDFEKNNLCLTTEELQLIKPYYTTEEVQKYFTKSKHSLWLIYTDSSYKNHNSLKNYPNLKKHLDKFSNVITSDNKPYGLHRAREERFFIGEKIIVQRKCAGHPSFSYADFDTYVSATFYVIKSDSINHKYLLGLLNSKLIEFWLKKKGKMQGDNFQLDKEPLLDIPIHKPTEKEQYSIINYVDQILSSKQTNPQSPTTALERKIDEVVFKLYDLTYAEVLVVCPDFWLSEGEYGEIKVVEYEAVNSEVL
jgi:tRNA1(Val) A37 N6-methylase TrmN6